MFLCVLKMCAYFCVVVDLKKLTLKGLDQMPKITDTLFSLVLSKMQLRELVLTSAEPVKKVMQLSSNFIFIQKLFCIQVNLKC